MAYLKHTLLFGFILATCNIINAQVATYKLDTCIYKSNFTTPLDTNIWAIEKLPTSTEIVTCTDGKLLLDTYGGSTVWFKKLLQGNVLISFKRTVIMQDGKNDRLSDLNIFWMATDSLKNNFFKRKGAFNEYDSLSMYYVGFGGNYNTTTRFRKYTSNGYKQIIDEYTDTKHLLQANKTYSIQIIMLNGLIQFVVDGEVFFSYKDEQPLSNGYFAFRSTRSRQVISNFKVHALQ